MPPRERVGVLVVRVWVEDADDGMLRARLTASGDVPFSTAETRAVAGLEAISAAIDEWLRAFADAVTR